MKIKSTIPFIIAGLAASSVVSAHTITHGYMVTNWDYSAFEGLSTSPNFDTFYDKQGSVGIDRNQIIAEIGVPYPISKGGLVFEYYGATIPASQIHPALEGRHPQITDYTFTDFSNPGTSKTSGEIGLGGVASFDTALGATMSGDYDLNYNPGTANATTGKSAWQLVNQVDFFAPAWDLYNVTTTAIGSSGFSLTGELHFTPGTAGFLGGGASTDLDLGDFTAISLSAIPTYILPDNQWHQISLPTQPSTGSNTVASIFGDDGLGVYGTDWTIYHYQPATNCYVTPALTDTLDVGEGYWIIQANGSDKTLTMPSDTMLVSGSYSSECNLNRCSEKPLATEAGNTEWSMIGSAYETPVKLSDTRVVTSSGTCTGGCNFAEADTAGVLQNVLWRYNGVDGYDQVTNASGNLEPWAGYWVNTSNSANTLSPKLLVPVPGSNM